MAVPTFSNNCQRNCQRSLKAFGDLLIKPLLGKMNKKYRVQTLSALKS